MSRNPFKIPRASGKVQVSLSRVRYDLSLTVRSEAVRDRSPIREVSGKISRKAARFPVFSSPLKSKLLSIVYYTARMSER